MHPRPKLILGEIVRSLRPRLGQWACTANHFKPAGTPGHTSAGLCGTPDTHCLLSIPRPYYPQTTHGHVLSLYCYPPSPVGTLRHARTIPSHTFSEYRLLRTPHTSPLNILERLTGRQLVPADLRA